MGLSESQSFFLFEPLVAPVRPQIFFSRTIEKLGRMCDQIGRTLEPWSHFYFIHYPCLMEGIMPQFELYILKYFKI